MCVSDWIGHMQKKKKEEETKANCGQWLHILFSVTGSCPFKVFRMWQQGNDKKKEEEENKHSFFKSESMASSLWQISFCYPYIHKKEKTFQRWFICVSARREHWGPMNTMVSSRLARSVKHIEKIWNPVFSSGLTFKHPQPSGKQRTHIDTIQNKASLGLLQHIAFSV